MLTKEEKQEVLNKRESTGGTDTQIELLTKKIEKLSGHLKENPKDMHSKKGFLNMISKRKKLLDYLKRKDSGRHEELVKELGIKKRK